MTMVHEKKMEQSAPVETQLHSPPYPRSAEQAVVTKENRISSHRTPSNLNAASSNKREGDRGGLPEQDAQYSSTGYCDYYYPGYDGTFSQLDDRNFANTGNNSTLGLQADQASVAYFMPGYGPYAGTFVGTDGQQQYFPPSGYLQHPPAYCYSWDQNFSADAVNGVNANHGNSTSNPSTTSSNSVKPSNACGPGANGLSGLSENSRPRSTAATPSSGAHSQKQMNKVPQPGYNFQNAGFMRAYPPAANFSAFSYQKQGNYSRSMPMTHNSNGRIWNGNDRFKLREKPYKNGKVEEAVELTCGPRAQSKNVASETSSDKEQLGIRIPRDRFNLAEFPTEYENAKFYVIKSYSEDDVHKCIKYSVWSSTPSGNKKLNAAFVDTEAKFGELGTKCPIFLFFSVNGSGQFTGLAEMTGRVDFNKNMDFWQLDKWNGFFPVKWHIVKDIPNARLRHIVLENNENRPVTYTRDTQEIGLKQGLEMLKIFKNYSAKTSVLDDFDFYDNREKAFQAKRSCKPSTDQMETHRKYDLPKHKQSGVENGDMAKPDATSESVSSLVDVTKNLSQFFGLKSSSVGYQLD